MPRQDTVDFLTAFAVGTVLGVGATLLLQPERSPKERVLRQLKPYRKQMRRSLQEAGRAARGGASATADLTTEIVGAGEEMLGDFREEVAEILGEARSEIQKMVRDQVRAVGKGAKRTRRKLGM